MILMPRSFDRKRKMNEIDYLTGDKDIMNNMSGIGSWVPFDKRIIEFCGRLSEGLISRNETKKYPDLLTLAFWLRKSNIKKLRDGSKELTGSIGRGLSFHIAPGNIALSFAYSLMTGLLTGNTNIVRMPSRQFEQADIFCEVLNTILTGEPEIGKRICLIRYGHNKEITDMLSSMCHVRIIWGGDDTVNSIRKSQIPPRASEITFSNRFSVCLINSDIYLEEYDFAKTAHDFYLDTYLTDQNACSSPRIILWQGYRIKEARDKFWESLYAELDVYELADVTTVNKLLTFCKYAAENKCRMSVVHDNKIMRIEIDSLDESLPDHIGNSGFFYEYEISNINEVLKICRWDLQTLSYIGYNGKELKDFVMRNSPFGVDRIVPVGHTLDFSLIWDGRDIVREMTRYISYE